VEPAAVNVETDDPWKTLAPGDTIEDLRLQPQPPIPKFKSRVVSYFLLRTVDMSQYFYRF